MKTLATLATTLALVLCSTMVRAVEEPKYTVVGQHEGFEVREYPPYIAAEVVVPGSAGEAGNQGFRLLAGYIFGRNKGERKIPMTAPVTQAPAPQKIEMTAPVTQAAAEGGWRVQFVMPAGSTMETLPEPLDPQVKLREVPATRYAVIRYSGFWTEGNYEEHLQALQRAVDAAGLPVTGPPVYSRYDPPWIPWFMRRNEIWLRLAS